MSTQDSHTGDADSVYYRSIDLRSKTVEYVDRPDECTLYPRATSRDELMTTWMTARGDAFVDAQEMR
jgi:hypothetical protein